MLTLCVFRRAPGDVQATLLIENVVSPKCRQAKFAYNFAKCVSGSQTIISLQALAAKWPLCWGLLSFDLFFLGFCFLLLDPQLASALTCMNQYFQNCHAHACAQRSLCYRALSFVVLRERNFSPHTHTHRPHSPRMHHTHQARPTLPCVQIEHVAAELGLDP